MRVAVHLAPRQAPPHVLRHQRHRAPLGLDARARELRAEHLAVGDLLADVGGDAGDAEGVRARGELGRLLRRRLAQANLPPRARAAAMRSCHEIINAGGDVVRSAMCNLPDR